MRKSGGFHTPPARPRAGRSSRKPPTGGFLIAHHPRGIFVRMRLVRGRCRLGSLGARRNARVRCAVGLDCANLRQQERPDPLKGSQAGWRDVTSPTARVRSDGILGSAQANLPVAKQSSSPPEGARHPCGLKAGVLTSGTTFQQPRWQSISTVREGVTCASMSHPAAMSRRKTRGRCKSPCRAGAPVQVNLIW